MKKLLASLLICISSCAPVFANTYVPAKNVTVDAAVFTKNLTNADTDVQKALVTIDQLSTGGGGGSLTFTDGTHTVNNVSNLLVSGGTIGGTTPNATLTISATTVPYNNITYPTVDAALSHLLYVSPLINSFTNSVNNIEKGSTVSSTVLNWTVNKTMTTESLNQGIGSITPTLLTYTDTATYTTNRTYTLTVGDGTNTVSANTSISFLDSNYYGVNANTTLNDSQINALSSQLQTTRAQTRNGISPSAQYIYICYPASYGTATFTVNGLVNTDWNLTVQNHTNVSGSTTSYNVYRTNNLLTGTYNIVVS